MSRIRCEEGNNFIQEEIADYSTELWQYVVAAAAVLWMLRPWLATWKVILY